MNSQNIIHNELLFKPDKEGYRIEINLVNKKNASNKKVVSIKPKAEKEEPVEEAVKIKIPS